MNRMSDIELLLILSFYYVGKEKNAERFVALFNAYFGKDLSMQMILHEVSKFKNINPANNVTHISNDSKYQMLWDEYIRKDKISELKELYKSFRNQEFLGLISDSLENMQGQKDRNLHYTVHDEPKDIKLAGGGNSIAYVRNRNVVENALFAASYLCEGECGSELFVRKDRNTNYTEAHHLIPLKYQLCFDYSLDVEANVVSLCPRCHRLLHYGLNCEALLKDLFEKRKERLRRCRIFISYEKLLLLYSAMNKDEAEV